MNKNITRGLALAAITGAFTLLGATAANAIDIGGGDDDGLLGVLGGSSDSDLVSDLHLPVGAQAPVSVDGLTVDVLGSQDGIGSLGDGIFATTGSSNADVLADLGIDTSSLLGGGDDLAAVVGVPLDASNTWLSVLGNEPNGIVVVPTLSGEPNSTAAVDDVLDAYVDAPVDVTCSSVTVVSDYSSDCDPATTPGSGSEGTDGDLLDLDGILNGDLLGDDVLSLDQPVTLDDEQINVLDGDLLDGVLEEDGVDVDFGDSVIDPSVGTDETSILDEFLSAMVGAPVDLSDAWVSAFGENGGVVIVPDLTVGTSALTGGLITSEVLAPVTIDCVAVTVLSDYERDCGSSSIDEFPTDPETPATPEDPTTVDPTDTGIVGGTEDGTGDADALDPCAVVPTSATTGLAADDASAVNAGMLAMAALVGGLTAMGLLALGRKFSATK